MSGLGVHVNQSPTGLGAFLQATYDAISPVPALFTLDNNIKPDIVSKSPTTKLIFRTQQFGPDNANMYFGDPIAAGRARLDQCYPILKLNPADWYALDNEPGRSDAEGLTWLCNYYLGEMQRADELGIKLCAGEWSTGMPPIGASESNAILSYIENSSGRAALPDPLFAPVYDAHVRAFALSISVDFISIYAPMFHYAMQYGHIVGLHEYSLKGPMIGSPLCLRYRTLYNALPADARPKFFISEVGPDAGYGTGYTGQAYVDVVAAYDAELMKDIARGIVLGCALFKLGAGESNMAPVMPLLTEYVRTHPTPIAPPPPPPPDDEYEFVGHFNGITGVLISSVLDFNFALVADTVIETRYQKKAPPVIMCSFRWSCSPPELAGRVTVSHANGIYPAGTQIRIAAT